jgi:hypothetical protein
MLNMLESGQAIADFASILKFGVYYIVPEFNTTRLIAIVLLFALAWAIILYVINQSTQTPKSTVTISSFKSPTP